MFFRFFGGYCCCFRDSKSSLFAGWVFLVLSGVRLASRGLRCRQVVVRFQWRCVFHNLAFQFLLCYARGCSMPPPTRFTNNSLSAGLSPEGTPLSSSALTASSSALSGSGPPLSADLIADAVVRALGSSLPTIIASIQGNAPSPASSAVPPSSSMSTVGTSAVSVASGSSASSSGTFTLPAFVSTFTPVSAISDSSSARLVAPIASASSSSSSLGSLPCLENSSLWPKTDKAFIVGPGHAPVPAKLVTKITEGQFVELADLLSVNLRAVEQEPQAFLEGKLLVSKSKRRQVEISDILTWTEAFTIFQMVTCAAHPQRWSDLTKYKLLIIQTARQFSGMAWLE